MRSRRTRRLAAAACLFAVLIPATVAVGQQDPFTGRWALDVAKSTLPEPVPRRIISHIQCEGGRIFVVERIVDAEGKERVLTLEAGLDGKDHPLVGSPLADMVTFRRIDARTIEGTSKNDGKPVAAERAVVSPDGRTMTVTYWTVGPEGKRLAGTAVFEKQ